MTELELLAPARNADIGIAAIDCGADAVYIAGPSFGARQDAGNSIEDIRRLCDYAHKFGVRIFLTLNTILYDSELPEAERLLREAAEAGVDAVIAQDLAVFEILRSAQKDIEAHASTQCAIRTPEQARFYESLGASRIVLERQLSLDQIRAIREAVSCEIEFFVHGALCVCYSGQCYMSEAVAGRSANRGACVQACRSLYDLEDASGKVLVKNKALLSLKDFNLIERLSDLAEAGVCSFKIEGRLKTIPASTAGPLLAGWRVVSRLTLARLSTVATRNCSLMAGEANGLPWTLLSRLARRSARLLALEPE